MTAVLRPDDPLAILPRPASSFADACDRARFFDTGETHPMLPTSATRLFTHGQKSRRAVVLLHGITNNPQQWDSFGRMLHEAGANVLIPRLPFHGLADRLTHLPARLTPHDMAQYGADAVDVACGLGDEVAVVGLSAGGVYAAWAAQQRADVAQAILIAPFFGIFGYAAWTSPALIALVSHLPNQMRWWDEMQKDRLAPPHAYPMFSTHGLAATMACGAWVRKRAQTTPPLCRDIVMINNAADRGVDNAVSDALAADWKKQGVSIREYCFPISLGLPHDVIDQTQPRGQSKLVYAKLKEYLRM